MKIKTKMKAKGELPLLIIKKIFISLMVILFVSITLGCGISSSHAIATNRKPILILENTTSKELLFNKAMLILKDKLSSEGFTVVKCYVDVNKLLAELSSKNVRESGTRYIMH